MNRRWLRLKVSLRRLRWPLLFVGLWFCFGLAKFRLADGLGAKDALLSAFYFEVQGDPFSQGYAFWGAAMVFGVLIGTILKESLENYEERSRAMAGIVKDHTIIVGYSTLGKHLVEHCIKHNLPYVLIDKEREFVDDLLRKGEPVVVDDARTSDCLPAAHIARAKQLIVASNNLETSLIVTKKARDANPKLKITVRCHLEEFVEILEKLGADKVYSTSEITYRELKKHLDGAA